MASFNKSNSSRSDDLWAGGAMIGVSTTGLFAYIPCLFAILTSKELRNLTFYRLLVSLGISDCIGLTIWFLTGIYVLNHDEGVVSAPISIRLGMNILFFLWFNTAFHFIVVAFGRCLGVVAPDQHAIYFKPARKSTHWLVIIHFAALTFSSGSWIFPICQFNFESYQFAFGSEAVGTFYIYINTTVSSCAVTTLGVLYGLIWKGLRDNAARVGDSESTGQQRTKRASEVRMILQVFIVTALYCMDIMMFYASPFLTQNPFALFMLTTLMWIFNQAVNPYVYLVFNPKLRECVRKLFSRPAQL